MVVDRQLVATLHRATRRIIAWTAELDEADIGRLSALGVDGICTSYHPERVVAIRS
jgi:glycerophosphoryl diester phosphodiesterase